VPIMVLLSLCLSSFAFISYSWIKGTEFRSFTEIFGRAEEL
jgi:hypothetical protein